jgi:hypothetical protein
LVHRAGNDAAWWQEAGIDPLDAARKLRTEPRRSSALLHPSRPFSPKTASVRFRPFHTQVKNRVTAPTLGQCAKDHGYELPFRRAIETEGGWYLRRPRVCSTRNELEFDL